jgi:GDPmannose 4,6-dehydratase
MLQQQTPDDYVIATGETHTVREFIERSFAQLGMPIEWKGHGVNEVGIDTKSGKTVIKIDPKYFRPTEVELLIGDPTKAKEKMGWTPKTKFEDLVKIMVEADHALVKAKGH